MYISTCCRGDHKIGCDCVVFFPLDESKQCQSDVQKIASEKAKLGEKVGKYNRLAVANDCVEMKEVSLKRKFSLESLMEMVRTLFSETFSEKLF